MRTEAASAINTSDVWAIIVTYNSNISRIQEQLGRIGKECRIVIADNSTDLQARTKLEELAHIHHAHYLCMAGNVGIARAQNKGASHALSNGARFLLLLDDDSLPSEGMVGTLRSTFESLLKMGRAAVVCGIHMERGSSRVNSGLEIQPVSNMMSSGTFISSEIFNAVGAMDEGLFIDYVDFDWGWRAQSKGYEIILDPSAIFDHSLGEGNKRLLLLTIRIPSPIRHYFQFRNALLLVRRPYVPLNWKIARLIISPAKLCILILITENRIKRLRFAIKGVFDGFRGRSGPYSETGH